MSIITKNDKLKIIIAVEIIILGFLYLARPLFISDIKQEKNKINLQMQEKIKKAKTQLKRERLKQEKNRKITKNQAEKLKVFEKKKYREKLIFYAGKMKLLLDKMDKLRKKENNGKSQKLVIEKGFKNKQKKPLYLGEKTNIKMLTNGEILQQMNNYSKKIIESYASIRAEKLSELRNESYSEIYNKIKNQLSKPAINLKEPETQSSFQTIAQLKQYRKELKKSLYKTEQALNKTQLIVDMANPEGREITAKFSPLFNRNSNLNTTYTGKEKKSGGKNMSWSIKREKLILNAEKIKSQALPGRKINSKSKRRGWIYIDTWYIIGPWENHGKINWELKYQPEFNVDLSKTYNGGKNGKKLTWKFFQSDTIRCTPPDDQTDATYYAYTEIYCEQSEIITVAIASDDAAELFLNDKQVWQDNGLSPWSLDENFTNLKFKKGFNTILLRIENGPGVCQYSILLCPEEP